MKLKTFTKHMTGLLTVFILSACGARTPATPDPDWLELPQDIAAETVSYRSSENELNVSVRYNSIYSTADAKYAIYYKNTTLLELAKKIFEEQYPGWIVHIQPEGTIVTERRVSSGGYLAFILDLPAEERYYRELPDRLMEAGAPDVIGLDGADKVRLANEGLLLDLQDYIDLDRLLSPVRLNMTKTGALYGVPVRYSIPTLYTYFNPDILSDSSFVTESDTGETRNNWTWQQTMDYLEPFLGPDKAYQYFIGESPQRLTMYLVNYNYGYIYDYSLGRYHFDHPVFEETLQTVKELCRRGWIWDVDSPETEDNDEYQALYNESFFNQLYELRSFPFGITDYNRMKVGGGSNYALFPSMKNAEGLAIDIAGEYAVNANSPKKEAAIDFINILLSDEVQNDIQIRYQPAIADLNAEGYASAMNLFRKPSPSEIANFNQRRQTFYSDVTRIYGPNGAPYVMDIILKHTRAYYQDRVDLSNTIQNIQAEVDSYLHD